MTGLATEWIFENSNEESSKTVDLFDWSNTFLTMHTSETEKLLDANLAYFSPMLMVAFNLTPQQVFMFILVKSPRGLYYKNYICPIQIIKTMLEQASLRRKFRHYGSVKL